MALLFELGVVAMDLREGKPIWSEHLDLTTDKTTLKAYIYSSPTVVDLDGACSQPLESFH